jgi:hypothetical protein
MTGFHALRSAASSTQWPQWPQWGQLPSLEPNGDDIAQRYDSSTAGFIRVDPHRPLEVQRRPLTLVFGSEL